MWLEIDDLQVVHLLLIYPVLEEAIVSLKVPVPSLFSRLRVQSRRENHLMDNRLIVRMTHRHTPTMRCIERLDKNTASIADKVEKKTKTGLETAD